MHSRSPSSSPYINFLLYPSAYPFGGNSGVCLFFLKRWNGTTAVSEARDTRSVGARGAATRHERVPPIDPSLHRLCFAGEGEERERESGQPILSLYRDLRARTHTSLLRKTFPILRVPRVYRVNERILSLQLFPPTCGKHFSSIFFSPFFSFFFFQNPGFKKYWIFAIGLQQRIQTDLSRPSFRYIRRGYFWRR